MIQDIEAIAFKDFEEQMPMILLKTITRGLTKYLAFRTANKKDKSAGFLVNIFNFVTESADTRSWLSLPNNYQMIRTTLPSGKHTLQLNFYDNKGVLVKSEKIDNIEIKSGKFTFLNYRTYK
jgi:hypothetical protein